MSRKTWKDLAPKQAANKPLINHDTSLDVLKPSLDNLVAASPKVSALLEEQKRLADNMKRLTGGTLNTDNDPRFPVTALDDRRKEIEDWAKQKQATFEKYKKALPTRPAASATKPQSLLERKNSTKKNARPQVFNRPLPEKWEERRERLTRAALKAKTGIDSGTRQLDKFDDKLSSLSKQLSELKNKTGGELPPELASLDMKLNAARKKSASLKALTRADGLKKKASENKTLARWIEKRDQAQNAIRAVGDARSALSSFGSKINRPRKDARKGTDKEQPKRRKEDGSSDLDRRREQSAEKRAKEQKKKKAEQDRMNRRNERAKARRKEKKASKYA